MAYREGLVHQVRFILANQLPPQVFEEELNEKKMFGGLAFMVRGKMTVTVDQTDGQDRVMVRIGKDRERQILPRKGAIVTQMKGRSYHGYLDLTSEALQDLEFWINLALQFNQELVQ